MKDSSNPPRRRLHERRSSRLRLRLTFLLILLPSRSSEKNLLCLCQKLFDPFDRIENLLEDSGRGVRSLGGIFRRLSFLERRERRRVSGLWLTLIQPPLEVAVFGTQLALQINPVRILLRVGHDVLEWDTPRTVWTNERHSRVFYFEFIRKKLTQAPRGFAVQTFAMLAGLLTTGMREGVKTSETGLDQSIVPPRRMSVGGICLARGLKKPSL